MKFLYIASTLLATAAAGSGTLSVPDTRKPQPRLTAFVHRMALVSCAPIADEASAPGAA